ncbi:MAG TPA: type I-E CRISPR-associated protein Cse2/CasB [Methylococcus sp.]|nr:type I-E CRISPR-associated protein Cse2/CasB [Methylococcus sp.]
MTQAQPKPEGDSLATRIAKLAGVLASAHYPGGDRAALKRWSPDQPVPLAFYRLWLRHLGTELPPEEQTATWALIAWGLALMGEGTHRPDRPLGQVLAESGFAEARLERLLAALDAARLDLFASAVRFLAAKGEGFNWRDAALLLLTADADKRESIHRRIAADYYRQLRKQESLKQGKE